MVDERTLYWGARDEARYRSRDDDPIGGDFVVAETLDSNGDPVSVLLRWSDGAGEWVVGGPLNMGGNDLSNVGALDADSATVSTAPSAASDVTTKDYVDSSVFAGSHTDLTDITSDDHHIRYADSEARLAVAAEPLQLNTRTSDPSSPGVGTMWYRSDLD